VKLANPQVGIKEALAVYGVLRSGELTQGKVSEKLQLEIQDFTKANYAFVTSSATTALHIAIDSFDFEPGSEILVSDFSFPASGNSIVKAGHIPKFIDINLETFNIDVDQIERAITSKTKAIMPVYAFGAVAYLDQLKKIAKRNNLKIIADAACAIGVTFNGCDINSFADATIYSFHPRKLITSGEGGAVTTNDESIANKIKLRRSHGSVRTPNGLSFIDAGFNFRLSDINAAVARVQLKKIEKYLSKRRKLALRYNSLLNLTDITVPAISLSENHTFQSYVVLLPPDKPRNEIIKMLGAEGIETTLGTYAMHSQPYFQELSDNLKLKNSKYAQDHSLSLPLHTGMHLRDVDRVVKTLVQVLSKV
jgi:dTDP-4-amino-4,6-dideoxygalactose transaminase